MRGADAHRWREEPVLPGAGSGPRWLTVVISPLIALMKDQVQALQGNGIAAAFLNSSLTFAEERLVQQQAAQRRHQAAVCFAGTLVPAGLPG
jgi:superfamily II DNA helicase RecQ